MSETRVTFRVTPYQIGNHVVVFRYVEVTSKQQRNFITEVHGIYKFNSRFRAKLCTKRFIHKHNRCYKAYETRDTLALIVMFVARMKHNQTANFLLP